MDYLKFKEIIENDLKYINLEITDESKENLYKYMNNLIEWNQKINLTAIKNEEEIILKHFVDSIYIKNMVKGRVLDIGSGAGFPGIPLRLVNNNINLVSIDSVNKKINFQKDTAEKLSLNNIEIIHTRAENLAQNKHYREQFDFVISRAVANLSTLSEYMLPFTKIGGKCICMKGPNCLEEIDNAKNAIKLLGGSIEKIEEYKIADDIDRVLVVISKEKSTNKIYPRGQGKPSKDPLK